ncbi:MAG: hypothetical protein N2506_04070 [Dehalococcoidales bacterium]|nr:hypothetical protein [Dehalococcoidales bacterium]
MQKIVMIFLIMVMVSPAVLLAGCSSGGVDKETYDALQAQLNTIKTELDSTKARLSNVQAELDTTKAQLATLSAKAADNSVLLKELTTISAYLLWSSYYYYGNIIGQSDDVFLARLGMLVAGIGDADTQAAFNTYYNEEAAYRLVLASLPQNSDIWTKEQFDKWKAAGDKRNTALEQVGAYLYRLFEKIAWFNPQQ